MKKPLISITGGILLFLLLFGALVLWQGTPRAALDWLRGDSFSVTPRSIDLGDRIAGSEGEVLFSIKNISSKPIVLSKAKPSCSCVSVENVPLTLNPRETSEIRAKVRFPKDKPVFRHFVTLVMSAAEKTFISTVFINATVHNPLSDPAEPEMSPNEP